MIRILGLAPFVLLGLTGCGLQPLYENGTHGQVAAVMAGIEVAPIGGGKAGWLMRNNLNDRLSAMTHGAPRYRLTVQLDDKLEGLGIRTNDNITREQRTLRARYQLRDINADDKAAPILDRTESDTVGLDVASSDYATGAAEDTALEQLATSIADRIIAEVAVNARTRLLGPNRMLEPK